MERGSGAVCVQSQAGTLKTFLDLCHWHKFRSGERINHACRSLRTSRRDFGALVTLDPEAVDVASQRQRHPLLRGARLLHFDVLRIDLDPKPSPTKSRCYGSDGTRAHEGIEHDVAGA